MMRRAIGGGALAIVLGLSVFAQSSPLRTVTRIVDGDTIVVEGAGTVRLLGIDAPETDDPRKPVEAIAKQAATVLSELALGKTVRLEFEGTQTDRYNRILAYAHLADGTHLNAEMVQRGYAQTYTAYPFSKSGEFLRLQAYARADGRGLWASETTAAASQAVQPPLEILPEPTQVTIDLGTRTTALYHRADCPWLRGVTTTKVFTVADARKRYFQAHCLCVHGEEKTPPCPHVTRPAQSVADPVETPAGSTPATLLEKPAPARALPIAPKTTPAKAPTSIRCQATTKKGAQCLRNAQPGRSFCWQH